MTYPLVCPAAYLVLSDAEIKATTNGCGPRGWRIDLVPDSLGGLDISYICRLHDWQYIQGGSEADRKQADIIFYVNLAHAILTVGGPLQAPRMAGAVIMYKGVRVSGARYFGVGA